MLLTTSTLNLRLEHELNLPIKVEDDFMMTMDKANAKTGYVVVDKNWMEKGRRYMVGSVQQVVVEENIEYEGLQAWQRARNVIFLRNRRTMIFMLLRFVAGVLRPLIRSMTL